MEEMKKNVKIYIQSLMMSNDPMMFNDVQYLILYEKNYISLNLIFISINAWRFLIIVQPISD